MAGARLNLVLVPPFLANQWVRRTLSALALGVVVTLMLAVREHLNILNIGLIFLICVIFIALFTDRWTSAAAAVAAFLLFDYFFVVPYSTLTVARADHVLALFVFLGVAILTSWLVYRIRTRTIEELQRGRQMETLYELSGALISDVTLEPLLAGIVERVAGQFDAASCTILMPDEHDSITVRSHIGAPPDQLDRDDAALIAWTIEHGMPTGIGAPHARVVQSGRRQRGVSIALPRRQASTVYIPIAAAGRIIGVMRVVRAPGHRFTDADQRLLATFANQAALAIERARLTEEATRAAVLARSDELKSALLSAVSHDLRTPLASIKASATSLLQDDIRWSPEDERDLLQAIDEETDRLSRIIGNLLDLTRIEAGVLQPQLDWNEVEELIHEALRRMQPLIAGRHVDLEIEEGLPPARFDFVEMEQVLINLIENAIKYSPPGSPLALSAASAGAMLEICVADRGPGIPAGAEERIFDRFQRLNARTGVGGAGIGLSICRGIVEAHGGRIWADQTYAGGARLCLTLPVAGPPNGPDAVSPRQVEESEAM